MPDFRMCNRCVLDSIEVPDITFSEQGVCNYCIDWIEYEKKRKVEATNLPWVYDRFRRDGKEYDVLLGLSGGVDSSLCLHYLIENEIRPLCWSMDNGYNTPEADENVMRMVEALKVPYQKIPLEQNEFKGLQAAFLSAGVKNVEIPTDHCLMALSYRLAETYGIKWIVGGGNHATEGIMPESYGYNARDLTHIKAINRRYNKVNLSLLPTISLPQYLRYRFLKGIKIVNLLDYYDYDREAAKRILKEKYGWKDYGEKHCESVFTQWFQNFYLPTKWKMDKRKPHYSSLINSGQMTRSAAVENLKYLPEFPELGIENRVMKYEKHEHSDYPTSKWAWDFLSGIYGHLKRDR